VGGTFKFDTLGDVEALGVTWLELSEISDKDTYTFVADFGWRPETMQSFVDAGCIGKLDSALVKVTCEDPDDNDRDDDVRFRVILRPEENSKELTGMSTHRMMLAISGGKVSSCPYQIFCHTVDPTYQVHIKIEDHRTPMVETQEVFHQWHPLMAGLKQRPRLRFLLRLKALDSGPLDAMCGCCG